MVHRTKYKVIKRNAMAERKFKLRISTYAGYAS